MKGGEGRSVGALDVKSRAGREGEVEVLLRSDEFDGGGGGGPAVAFEAEDDDIVEWVVFAEFGLSTSYLEFLEWSSHSHRTIRFEIPSGFDMFK